MTEKLTSWGRTSQEPHQVIPVFDRKHLPPPPQGLGLPFGMGRSYGDLCLNPQQTIWSMRGLDRFLDFDSSTGVLNCEAGVVLGDIQRLLLPKGWMVPVTPGTQFVTMGGAIASDVHGKNHHRFASLGNHIRKITVLRTNGDRWLCSPNENSELFYATIGGLGLTGVITDLEVQLRSVKGPWLETQNIPYFNLDEFFHLAETSQDEWEHTVSWVDCYSGSKTRGIFMRGRHTVEQPPEPRQSKKLSVPFTPPLSLINKLTLPAFNSLYFWLQSRKTILSLTHYQPFFYPLDSILNWNRVYGHRGFFQYQCVIPTKWAQDATKELMHTIAVAKEGSFLSVLKTFGPKPSLGLLSFPMPGVTLALDFPNKGPSTRKLFERLDTIVHEAGGRIYLAKDANVSQKHFQESYPHLNEFVKWRDPGISSGLSRRLFGT